MQTFKKQAGTTITLWLLLCTLGSFVLVGAALLAEYAFNSVWAAVGVLSVELTVGIIVYRLSLESAVARGRNNAEKIVAALSRAVSPIDSAS